MISRFITPVLGTAKGTREEMGVWRLKGAIKCKKKPVYFSTLCRMMVSCQEVCVSRDTKERAPGLYNNITVCRLHMGWLSAKPMPEQRLLTKSVM